MSRKEKYRARVIGLALVATLLAAFATNATADIYASGSLSCNNDGLNAGGDWKNDATEITYSVSEVLESGVLDRYRYDYTLSVGNQGAISHFIFETSQGAAISNFKAFANADESTSVTGTLEGPASFSSGSGNPGMPTGESIYGFKLENPSVESTYLAWSFESYHKPMWGDFYAKDGSSGQGQNKIWNHLSNTGFGDLGDPLTDLARYNYENETLSAKHILVPDTQVVPVPGAVFLGFLGLSTAGMKLRRYRAMR